MSSAKEFLSSGTSSKFSSAFSESLNVSVRGSSSSSSSAPPSSGPSLADRMSRGPITPAQAPKRNSVIHFSIANATDDDDDDDEALPTPTPAPAPAPAQVVSTPAVVPSLTPAPAKAQSQEQQQSESNFSSSVLTLFRQYLETGKHVSVVGSAPPSPKATPARHRLWAYTAAHQNDASKVFPWNNPYSPRHLSTPPPSPPPTNIVVPSLVFAPALSPSVAGFRVRLTIDLFVPDSEDGRARLGDLERRFVAGEGTFLQLVPMDLS